MSGSQGTGQTDERPLIAGFILVAIAAGSFALWWKFHAQISTVVMAAQHWEMNQIGRVTDRYAALDAQVTATDPDDVGIKQLWRLCGYVGGFFRIPATVILVVLAGLCLLLNAPGRYTRLLDLDRLMRVQSRVFPFTAAFASRHLLPLQVGDTTTPRPLDPPLKNTLWIERNARAEGGSFDPTAARRELVRQLGPRWTGIDTASPLARCLFAAFSLQAARKRDRANALLGALSEHLTSSKGEGRAGPDTALAFPAALIGTVDKVLDDAELIRPCVEIAARHAYASPALMSVLSHARVRAGVLAPGQFNCIKLMDRRLWYALHGLGFPKSDGPFWLHMPNPRIEAIAARDHWFAECEMSQPLVIPAIDRALDAIHIAASQTAAGHPSSTPSEAA